MTTALDEASRPSDVARLIAAAARTRVLAIGAINYDEIFVMSSRLRDDSASYVTSKRVLPGGHAGNCATALAQLGLRTSILGAVGNDFAGYWLREDLARRGVDTSLVQVLEAPTGRATIPVFSDSHFMILERGANDALREVPPAVLRGFDAIALFDPPLDVLERLVALVRQGERLPDIYWTPGGHYCSREITTRLLPLVRCAFLNVAETASLDASFPGALEQARATMIVETRGARGAVCRVDGRVYQSAGFATACVDPTGAGDLFAACFLLADRADLPMAECLSVANAGGMIAVETVGARSPNLDLDRLVERITRVGALR